MSAEVHKLATGMAFLCPSPAKAVVDRRSGAVSADETQRASFLVVPKYAFDRAVSAAHRLFRAAPVNTRRKPALFLGRPLYLAGQDSRNEVRPCGSCNRLASSHGHDHAGISATAALLFGHGTDRALTEDRTHSACGPEPTEPKHDSHRSFSHSFTEQRL